MVRLSGGGTRPCKAAPQRNSQYCSQHSVASSKQKALSLSVKQAATPSLPHINLSETLNNSTNNIQALIANKNLWVDLVSSIPIKAIPRHSIEQLAEKDLHLTEALRHAVQSSTLYPEIQIVFKGGTSLAKAYSILRRFSEDIDLNIVPYPEHEFGHHRRKKAIKEIQTRLENNISLPITHNRVGSNFSKTIIRYSSNIRPTNTTVDIREGVVLLEMMIREQPPNLTSVRNASSLAGEAAKAIDPSLLEEYPILKPFEVLTADPIIALVDKLDALNWRSHSDRPEDAANRARDVYDLSCLLSSEEVAPRVNKDVVAELHEAHLRVLPARLSHRFVSRPKQGFGDSLAFTPGSVAYKSLQKAYPKLETVIYSPDDWITFDEAMNIIRSNAHLL